MVKDFTEGFIKEERLVGMAYIYIYVYLFIFTNLRKKENRNSYLEISVNNS